MSSLLRGVLFGMLRYFIQLRNTNLKPVPEHAHGLDKIKFSIYQKRTKQWQLLLQSVLRRFFFFSFLPVIFLRATRKGAKRGLSLPAPPPPFPCVLARSYPLWLIFCLRSSTNWRQKSVVGQIVEENQPWLLGRFSYQTNQIIQRSNGVFIALFSLKLVKSPMKSTRPIRKDLGSIISRCTGNEPALLLEIEKAAEIKLRKD